MDLQDILNLKYLNSHIRYIHSKMDDMNSNGSYVQGLFFVSADLKRAYYSVPIREAERDWLRLRWNQPLQAPGRRFASVQSCFVHYLVYLQEWEW